MMHSTLCVGPASDALLLQRARVSWWDYAPPALACAAWSRLALLRCMLLCVLRAAVNVSFAVSLRLFLFSFRLPTA